MVTTTIKKGYKLTELGVIPEDWSVNKLDDLTIKIGSGITPTGGETVYKEYGRPLVRSQNIGWGKLLLDDIAFIDDETHQTFPNTEIKLHDVFLNISGASIGRSSYANEKLVGGNVNQHVCIIRTVDRLLDPVFLNIFLLSNNGQRQIDSFQSGGNRQGLNIGQIKTFQISLPPTKPEQSAIATVLSDTDTLIDHLDKLITKKKGIKQGTMQQLLTGKKRLPGFSEKWEEKKLAEIADFLKGNGLSKSKINNSGQYSCILYGELFTTYSQAIHEVRSRTNSKEGLPSMKGDILMPGSTTTIGIDLATASALHKKDVLIGGDVIVIRKKEQEFYNSDFLANYLTHVSKYKIAGITQGITIIHLHGSRLQEILVKIPKDVNEQTTIATILSDMDNEIERLQQKRDKYAMLKNGMMQQLLTGNIRIYATK